MTKRELKHLLVLTGDHGQQDPTKWEGGYSEHDLMLHQAMCNALESHGRFRVEVCSKHSELMELVKSSKPDLVLNFCDTGFNNRATQELHVPALLELLDVPYTGAGPQAMVLAYDKSVVNLIAASIGIACPTERVLLPDAPLEMRSTPEISFPAFVKPAEGDGSVGISRDALVADQAALRKQVEWLRQAVPGATVLIQEYLPGPEFGLGLLGNPGAFVALPMLEVNFSKLPAGLPPILAFESKTGPENPYDQVGIQPAKLPEEQRIALVASAKRLFERLGCRDYARFDFRTADDGVIKLMEVNPNPAWSREAKLAHMAGFAGMQYPELLLAIVEAAWDRV